MDIPSLFQHIRSEHRSVPRICRTLMGDWTDVRNWRSGEPIELHVALKALGNQVFGSIHVTRSNQWLRVRLSPGWFCAIGTVYERRGRMFVHVATVRLCHSNKEGVRSVLWQVRGNDQSGYLPREAVLWEHR